MMSRMKSAYELAMSRLERENPLPKMDDATRAALAEVDNEFAAKEAERRVFLEGEIRKAAGDPAAQDELRAQLARELARLAEQREEKKERIRKSAGQ